MTLHDKVALVTGAGSGIGKATALAFARAGGRLAVLSDTKSEIEATAKEIGKETLPLVADVSDPIQLEFAVKQVVEKFRRLDIVHANAGINGMTAPIDDLTPQEWDKTIDINLKGTFLTIRYTVPHLKQAGGGSIIVTSSINGTRYFANTGGTAYAVSKAGQLAMVEMLAVELGPFKIRINAICPGSIDTDIDDNSQKRNVDKVRIKAKFEREIPLWNKPGKADDVAELALFLASDASRHITGTPVFIDGAESLLQ